MSLYLKYRPQNFDNLVGQDFISETLRNAILQDKLVGAYLFTGPRGTGKTSTARIFAKTINCLNQKDGNPCLQCEICEAFAENRLIDIIEIDAASYTGVDNIRDIIEKAQFTPSQAKYKVYIIDEVHMLSKGAFNALLKILEEPPSHVKFILATTEINKVPETILSRCQRYDFKNIDNESIEKRLLYIAKEEDIKIEKKALYYIVKNASGGMRNAINLFEQLIVGDKITYENIVENLGITEEDTLQQFFQKLLENENSIIQDFDTLLSSGKNIKLFLKDLIFYVKDEILLLLRENKNYTKELLILEILDEAYAKTKNSLDEKITFLSAILKIISSGKQNIEIKEIKKEKQKTEEVFYKKETKKEENITNDMIEDIFGNPSDEIFVKKETKKEEFVQDESELKKNLIQELKKIGGKGVIILGLEGANFKKEGETFIIVFIKKMPYNSINNTESLSLIHQALENLGHQGKIELRLLS
ncbi:DNA polymerase III subunit gamma/tau [Candidatus Gracilibacteria bacterium]|nr:DNA polymerase III subunit gamma/tau [Candidatus Gracilibacteria bacterium]NUJ99427.1 DNA polymerase III subunit gamma/tau [Candidatus Gracilibacteria bacterium]